MSEARREILEAIARHKARHRKAELPAHIVPRRALLQEPELSGLFETMARKSAASIEHITSLDELPMATHACLQRLGVSQPTIYLNGPELARLNWNAPPEWKISMNTVDRNSPIGIAQAFCGIAETGSLALLSESGVSAAAWFLPDILIVALARDQIFRAQEDCWRRLREPAGIPRVLTFMTGPSRTGDIEQKIVIGAHGPKHLHIVFHDKA